MFQLRQHATLGSGIPTLLINSTAPDCDFGAVPRSFVCHRATTVRTGSSYSLTIWRGSMGQRPISPWRCSIRTSLVSSDRFRVHTPSPFAVLLRRVIDTLDKTVCHRSISRFGVTARRPRVDSPLRKFTWMETHQDQTPRKPRPNHRTSWITYPTRCVKTKQT